MITQKLTDFDAKYCFRLIRGDRVYYNGIVMCHYSSQYHQTIMESL